MPSVHGYGAQKEGQEESKIQEEIQMWRLRKSEVKEEFAEGVNNKCDSNEDWFDLKESC